MIKITKILYILSFFVLSVSCSSMASNPEYVPGQTDNGEQGGNGGQTHPSESENGGYLFIHTGKGGGKYYYMYYAISPDGVNWTSLNSGDKILPTYYGFPYVTYDEKGTWYLIGTSQGTLPHYPIIWKSNDLITWTKKDLPRTVLDVPDTYENDTNSFGAVKVFYDIVGDQFMLTWHASEKKYPSGNDKWRSMRTFYVLTKDFETFTPAAKLFDFSGNEDNMAQIDANIHYEDGWYYAVVKDERWEGDPGVGENWKTPRICRSRNLTGPYGDLSGILTKNWREAPTLTKSLDGQWWYMYVEDYTKSHYELYRSNDLSNQNLWEQVQMTPPDNCRHGCVITIDKQTYNSLIDAWK